MWHLGIIGILLTMGHTRYLTLLAEVAGSLTHVNTWERELSGMGHCKEKARLLVRNVSPPPSWAWVAETDWLAPFHRPGGQQIIRFLY